MCALLQMQLGDYDAARAHQRRFGCRYRVAPAVWKLVNGADAAPPAAPDRSGVQRWEGAVPPALLARLRAAFAIDSPFWEQTDYSARGYFSFWEATAAPPATLIDVYVREVLLPLVANADDVVGAEWWVHTRASRRSIGHQMHFDTEEATLQLTGEVVHPTVSSVLYLSGAGGDPTVVFDQRADDDAPAAHAHVSHPVEGAVLLFPGDRLHCVCPAAPRDARKRGRDDDAAAAAALRDARDAPQRVTLMVGLWTRDVASVCRRRPLDACGPLPRPTRSCTWPSLIALRADDDAAALGAAAAPPTRHAVPRVAAPWERIDGRGGGARRRRHVGGPDARAARGAQPPLLGEIDGRVPRADGVRRRGRLGVGRARVAKLSLNYPKTRAGTHGTKLGGTLLEEGEHLVDALERRRNLGHRLLDDLRLRAAAAAIVLEAVVV